MILSWQACLYYQETAYAHLLNPAPIKTFSSNFLAWNSTMMATHTFVPFQHTSLHIDSTLLTIYNIVCPTRGISSASMQQCLAVCQLGSSSTFTHISCIFAIQTAKSFCPISLQHRQQQFRLQPMTPFELIFHPRNNGYRPMPMTPSCVWYKPLH